MVQSFDELVKGNLVDWVTQYGFTEVQQWLSHTRKAENPVLAGFTRPDVSTISISPSNPELLIFSLCKNSEDVGSYSSKEPQKQEK